MPGNLDRIGMECENHTSGMLVWCDVQVLGGTDESECTVGMLCRKYDGEKKSVERSGEG